ncbi:MAG: RibD family protein [Planctomycetota bacterium]
MNCDLSDDLPWPALLAARERFRDGADAVTFVPRDGWRCEPASSRAAATSGSLLAELEPGAADAAHAATATAVYRTDARGLPDIQQKRATPLDPAMATAARVYLPVLIGAERARRRGASFVAGHVTQTIDGRIACENGQSQWIGNDADQHHAHRMRALLDGVMVGATTALRDDPKLTVRHVEGTDPRRVVISGRGRALTEGPKLSLMQAPGCDVFVDEMRPTLDVGDAVRVHRIAAVDGQLAPETILARLRERGVHSIYLEGGAGVLSSFLNAGQVDLLQVHIAALVLGSGLPSLRLPAVDHVDDGLHVHMDHAMLDGHVLLTCRPRT